MHEGARGRGRSLNRTLPEVVEVCLGGAVALGFKLDEEVQFW